MLVSLSLLLPLSLLWLSSSSSHFLGGAPLMSLSIVSVHNPPPGVPLAGNKTMAPVCNARLPMTRCFIPRTQILLSVPRDTTYPRSAALGYGDYQRPGRLRPTSAYGPRWCAEDGGAGYKLAFWRVGWKYGRGKKGLWSELLIIPTNTIFTILTERAI